MNKQKLIALLMALGLVAAACGSDDIAETADAAVAQVEDVVEGEDEAMEDDEEAMEDEEEAMEDDEEAMEDEAMEDEAMEDDEEAMEDEDAMEDVTHDLNLAQSDLGQILTDANGYTVYLFTNDEQGAGTSACEGDCLAAWPAVGEITSPSGALDADLIGSIERSDGTVQATYNGWPLYRFANDEAPGDTNGQGVNDIWWVLDAEGNAIA